MKFLRILVWSAAFAGSVVFLWWSHRLLHSPSGAAMATGYRYVLSVTPYVLLPLTFWRLTSGLMSLGEGRSELPSSGQATEYRPAPGTLWTILAFCAFPLFGLPYALIRDGFPLEDTLYALPTWLFFAWGAVYMARLRTVLDGGTVTTLTAGLRYRTHPVDRLSDVSFGGWTGDLLLHFEGGETARVSKALDGFAELARFFTETALQNRR